MRLRQRELRAARKPPRRPRAPSQLLELLLKNIEDASKTTRGIYLFYITFLIYCIITTIGTQDRQIFMNEMTKLPFFGLKVPLNNFFLLAPITAILLFIYLQIYLHRLKGLINELRKDYPRFKIRRVYPWLTNIYEDPEQGTIGRLQILVTYIFVWASLPLAISFISVWFIKKHDPVYSYLLATLPFAASIIMILFWQRYDYQRKTTIINKFAKIIIFFFFAGLTGFSVCMIPLAMEGKGESWFFNADLSYEVLVEVPSRDYPIIYWANMKGVHLEGANLTATVLDRADLRDASFQRANLSRAYLRWSDLSFANLSFTSLFHTNLQGANLFSANLHGADLTLANLEKANLTQANLREAKIFGTNLQGAVLWMASMEHSKIVKANLQGAELRGAELRGADLQGADLSGAKGLTLEQLSKVKTLYKAKLDPDLLKQVKEKYPHLLEEPKLEPASKTIEP